VASAFIDTTMKPTTMPEPSTTAHASEHPTPLDEPAARRRGTALCLSGGGYRAALFHLGAVRRLNELGILARLDTVSGVSGGSILANLLADPRLDFEAGRATDGDGMVGGFDDFVSGPLRELASRNVRTPALLSKLKPWRWFADSVAVTAMADELAQTVTWWSKPLRDNDVAGPAVVTGATEIGYGVDWVFEDPAAHRPHGRVGDYRLGYAAPPKGIRMADMVAASCAFPPFFGPKVLDGVAMGLTGGHPGLESPEQRAAIRRHVRLTDGGVYDNLGLEPVWKNHRTVLVSDGGGVFRARTERTVIGRMLRILGIATSGGQSVRSRWLQASLARGVITGTSWALDAVVEGCYPRRTTELINAVRTDLDAFSEQEQQVLERHGYLVADATVRAHAPELVTRDSPARPPHPDVADPAVADHALADSARRTLLGRF
jgi:NTE family protein